MVRVDLHIHTQASFDCEVDPRRTAERCRQLGLEPIFVTDHDTIDGARQLREAHPGMAVVVGQEVATTEGELIGLFLEAPIPSGLDPADAVGAIRAQGGLVYLEHPYDLTRRCLSESAIERLADQIDIVEIFNGRSPEAFNRRAEELQEILRAAPGAGSDAHTVEELGTVYIEMEEFAGSQDFIRKLHRGRVVRRPNRQLMEVRTILNRMFGRK